MEQIIKKRIEKINKGIAPDGYKKTSLGILPNDWETDITLNEIACLSKEKINPREANSNLICYELEHINSFSGRVNGSFGGSKINGIKSCFRKGDILFGKLRPYLGKYYFAKENGVCSTEIWVIRSKTIDPAFLYQIVSSKKFIDDATASSFGTKMPRADWRKISCKKYPFPKDKNEQEKIAQILMKWDEAIELQEKYIEKLEQHRCTLMKKLLKQIVAVEQITLDHIVKKEKGKAIIVNDGTIPIVDMDYLKSGVCQNYTNDSSIMATPDDLLLLWDGANAGLVLTGKCGAVGSTFVLLHIVNEKVLPLYLYYCLITQNEKILKRREGSGIPHMPKDYFKTQKISIPSKKTQLEFCNVLSKEELFVSLQKQYLKRLKQQRKILQQYLLTGAVRVK